MRSQEVAADLSAWLRARNAAFGVSSPEEGRVERYLIEAASAAGYTLRTWDVAQGVCDMAGRPEKIGGRDPGETLNAIAERANKGSERCCWVMRDLGVWLSGLPGAPLLRQLKNLIRMLPGTPRERAQAIIILSVSSELPPELIDQVVSITWPMPDRHELGLALDAAVATLPDELRASAAPDGQRDAIIDGASGLTEEQAVANFARSLVQWRRIDAATIAQEKKRIIATSRVLEWCDVLDGGFDAVGGLDVLKTWLLARREAYGSQARAFGLPMPKGILLVGVSGCGKSLSAKATASNWQVPLLRLDINAVRSKYVGESEGNLRRALKTIEVLGRTCIWIDEIEKVFAGATQGAADGGVARDAFGTFLTWAQERPSGGAFIVCTANDIEGLPPEFLRKGRFDEIWFIDLPNELERAEILKTALRAHGRSKVMIDHAAVARDSEGFSGAEVYELVSTALYSAFSDDAREITTGDLLAAAHATVPLSTTAREKIASLREWAKGRARFATSSTVVDIGTQKRVRALDL